MEDINKEELQEENKEGIEPAPEIIDGYKYCMYCSEKLDKDMMYCTRCGKYQLNNETNDTKADTPKEVPINKKIKPNSKEKSCTCKTVLNIISYVFFGLSLITFITALCNMMFHNVNPMSLFDSGYSAIEQELSASNYLLTSILFMISGWFLNYKGNKK